MTHTGSVLLFKPDRGYGIVKSESGAVLFVHFSAIDRDGTRELRKGERVEFDVVEGIQTYAFPMRSAVNVRLLQRRKMS